MTFGRHGAPRSSVSPHWRIGGTRGRAVSKGSVRYCCSRSGARSCNRDLLVRLVDHLKSKVDAGSMSCLGPYHSALSELAVLDSEAVRGAQVRARIRWVEEGEISSSYFFRFEKKRSADRWISALRESDGSIVSSPADLCRSLSSFYFDLFTASDTDPCALGNLLRVDAEHFALQDVDKPLTFLISSDREVKLSIGRVTSLLCSFLAGFL